MRSTRTARHRALGAGLAAIFETADPLGTVAAIALRHTTEPVLVVATYRIPTPS